MTEELREQLKHPQSRKRHEAIVQLARLKDEDALPLLNFISKRDPEPSLRQLAERAIRHILNDYSSTISRAQNQAGPPSIIPPFSNAQAEQQIQNAYQQYDQGFQANALQYLIKALDLAPMLANDSDVQMLAENLTGVEGAEATNLLADAQERKRFFGEDTKSSKVPISPRAWIILGLFVVVMSQFFLADGVEFINQALEELEVQNLKQSVQRAGIIDYYLVAPDTPPTDDGYPVLIALPDAQEDSSAMLRHFLDLANMYGIILIIPEFAEYRFADITTQTLMLDAVIEDTAEDYKLSESGVVLFGFGQGAIVATSYANRYPEATATVITSGGMFLYPPPEDVPYVVMYGAEDALLRGVNDNDVTFADLSEWSEPLNYLTIENIGHEINSQQIDIIKQVLLDVYR